MKKGMVFHVHSGFSLFSLLLLFISSRALTQSILPCSLCHTRENTDWIFARHANTLNDVAGELAANWQGQTPDSVISGSAAENCVACHSPLAVTTNGGMTETQVVGHYFTTTNGLFTDSTHAIDSPNWPHVGCNTCHDVPTNHLSLVPPKVALFNSTTANYQPMQTSSRLCGQCHGTLRFPETDHRIFDGWKMSRHGHRGQEDLAGELAASWAGKTPNDVIKGPDAENCIACHAPTAVKQLSGDTSEVMVLSRFFTTSGGTFTAGTTVADTTHWPDVDCGTCHNPHRPDSISFYNSSTRTYQAMSSPDLLCGQCHGNLRFPNTDHLSYNIEAAAGGVGVAAQFTMPGAKCTDCHMHKGNTDGTNSLMYKGHSWSVFIREPDGSTTSSCASCHPEVSSAAAKAVVDGWKAQFAMLDSIAQVSVATADSVMQGNTDSLKLSYLAEAKSNLKFAESDESGGFHNHNYSIALLNDAIGKSAIITGVQLPAIDLPLQFELRQNFPNPFNPSTRFSYSLPAAVHVRLAIYNVVGQEVATVVDEPQSPGNKSISFNAGNLPSGIYFYRLTAGKFTNTKKMLLLK